MPPTNQQVQNIRNRKIGLRSGTVAENAAYAMSDFGFSPNELMKENLWLFTNPAADKVRIDLWNEHLLNSVMAIFSFPAATYNILIITGAGPSAERYTVPGGKGSRETFRKCNRVLPDSQIIAQKTFMPGQIQEAVAWVMQNI